MIPASELSTTDVQLTRELHNMVVRYQDLTRLGTRATLDDWVDFHELRAVLFHKIAKQGYSDIPIHELEQEAAWAQFHLDVMRGVARRSGGDP